MIPYGLSNVNYAPITRRYCKSIQNETNFSSLHINFNLSKEQYNNTQINLG